MMSIPLAAAAVVLGAISRGNSNRLGTPRRTEALVGCWIGAILLSLWLLVWAGFPRMSGATPEAANRVKCGLNLNRIAQALTLYANNNGGMLPPDLGALITHAGCKGESFICPASDHKPARGGTPQKIATNLRANPKLHSSY